MTLFNSLANKASLKRVNTFLVLLFPHTGWLQGLLSNSGTSPSHRHPRLPPAYRCHNLLSSPCCHGDAMLHHVSVDEDTEPASQMMHALTGASWGCLRNVQHATADSRLYCIPLQRTRQPLNLFFFFCAASPDGVTYTSRVWSYGMICKQTHGVVFKLKTAKLRLCF